MRTIDEIRLENLQRLVTKAEGLSNLVKQSKKKLNRATLYQIIERVQTASGTPKNVGDDLARKIEDSLKLQRGWMDNDHSEKPADPGVEYVSRDQLLKLIHDFSTATPRGKEQILGAADAAPKLFSGQAQDAAGN